MVLGNICKSLAALGNESDADLPAAALLDAGSRLDACGIDFIGSALCRGQEACKSCAVGSLAAVESLVVGLRIVVGKQGLCDARDSRTAGDAVDLRGSSLDSLDRDLAGVALHSRSVLVEERNDLSLAAVDGSLYLRCGLVALLAALRTALLTLSSRLAAALGGCDCRAVVSGALCRVALRVARLGVLNVCVRVLRALSRCVVLVVLALTCRKCKYHYQREQDSNNSLHSLSPFIFRQSILCHATIQVYFMFIRLSRE